MRTDTELLTKKELKNNAKNLNYFDVLVFASTTGELDMDAGQKQDMPPLSEKMERVLLESRRARTITLPEYGEMIGGGSISILDAFNAPIVNEDPDFPACATFRSICKNTTRSINRRPGRGTR